MQILLINTNSSVSKLIHLTAKKYDYNVEEISDITELTDESKDMVFVDDEASKEIDIDLLKEKTKCDEVIFIAPKGSQKPEGYKYMLTKPFLPSDFQNIIENISNTHKVVEEEAVIEEIADKAQDESDDEEYSVTDEFNDIEKSEEKNEDLKTEEESEEKDNENEEVNTQNKEEIKDIQGSDESDDDIENAIEEDITFDEDLFIDDEDNIKAEENKDIDEEIVSDEKKDQNSSILDKEDIMEVKELLEDNEEEFVEDNLDINDKTITKSDDIKPGKEDFDISELKDDFDEFKDEEEPIEDEIDKFEFDIDKDIDSANLQENEKEKQSDYTDEFEDTQAEESINEEAQVAISDIKEENDIAKTEKTNTTHNSQEELDLIDEESLKELFDEAQDTKESKENLTDKEENMYIESLEKKKKKKKKKNKNKKIKDKKLIELQEEITSKLLDIDTLREVLDGMEIRIKFYNKNKR